MLPWYRGFTGPIETTDKPGRYKVTGILKAIEDQSNMIEITELPVGMWTQEMKEFLEKEVMGTEKGPGMVKDYEEHHTTNTVHFKVQMTDKGMELARTQGLETTFKVVSYINTTNMVAFDAGGRIRKYNSPEEILQDFFHLRLEFYQKRKVNTWKIVLMIGLPCTGTYDAIGEIVESSAIRTDDYQEGIECIWTQKSGHCARLESERIQVISQSRQSRGRRRD
jgi:DNA gyrase/topoisomerase IV subunit A